MAMFGVLRGLLRGQRQDEDNNNPRRGSRRQQEDQHSSWSPKIVACLIFVVLGVVVSLVVVRDRDSEDETLKKVRLDPSIYSLAYLCFALCLLSYLCYALSQD